MLAGVVILGGGVLGFSIAYHLAKEGIPSQVIEMDSIGAKASGRSDGILGNAASNIFYYADKRHSIGGARRLFVPFAEESYHRFPQLQMELKEKTGLDIQYAADQVLHCALSKDEEEKLRDAAVEARKTGVDIRLISGDDARAFENTLSVSVLGAVLLDKGQVEPYRYTLALAQGAESLGASITYAQAVGFRGDQARVTSVILSTGREVAADRVVIAMGPWSSQAISWLGLKLPLDTLRAQTLKMVSVTRPAHQVSFNPLLADGWPHAHILVSPRVDGTILVGYTEDRTDTWDDSRPETWLDNPTEEMKLLILEQAVRLVPSLEDARLVEHRAGVLGFPPVEGMMIGPVPKWENVYIAVVGDSGLATSPAVGRAVSDLLIGGNRAERTLEELKPVLPIKFIS